MCFQQHFNNSSTSPQIELLNYMQIYLLLYPLLKVHLSTDAAGFNYTSCHISSCSPWQKTVTARGCQADNRRQRKSSLQNSLKVKKNNASWRFNNKLLQIVHYLTFFWILVCYLSKTVCLEHLWSKHTLLNSHIKSCLQLYLSEPILCIKVNTESLILLLNLVNLTEKACCSFGNFTDTHCESRNLKKNKQQWKVKNAPSFSWANCTGAEVTGYDIKSYHCSGRFTQICLLESNFFWMNFPFCFWIEDYFIRNWL